LGEPSRVDRGNLAVDEDTTSDRWQFPVPPTKWDGENTINADTCSTWTAGARLTISAWTDDPDGDLDNVISIRRHRTHTVTAQHSTAQHSTAQHSTTHHITAHHITSQ